MRIYHVEFSNQKYWGESNKKYSVIARSITEAENKALALLKKEGYGFSNWRTEKVEWADTIDS